MTAPRGERRRGPAWLLPVVLAAVSIVTGLVISQRGDDGASGDAKEPSGAPGEVFAEPAANVGPTPFTPPVVTTSPQTTAGATAPSSTVAASTTTTTTATSGSSTPGGSDSAAPTTTPPVVLQRVPGNQPGLYGGSMNDKVCDVAQLIAFLQADAAKAAAWADAQGIQPADIPMFIGRLTPVLLRADTRVTNFGYADGRAVSRQAVLQAGTAVLVDDRGVPRARCKCGNPLAEPRAVSGPPTYTGETWPNFDPASAQVVTPAPEPIGSIVLTDPATGDVFERPVGTDGSADGPVTPGTGDSTPTGSVPTDTTLPVETTAPTTAETTTTLEPSTTSAETTTTVEPTTTESPTSTVASSTTVPVPVSITADGDIAVSSEYPGNEFPVALAFDGDRTTSWFSAGDADTTCQPITPGEKCSDLIWVYRQPVDVMISGVAILNNSQHPDYPTGFGFGSVTIEITNLAGVIVHTETIVLPGEDPDVVIAPGVSGHAVHVIFEGHDSPDCGGISEFGVYTTPTA